MISSASTLLLATLVFSSASVLGAPIRVVDASSEAVARSVISTPVQPVARANIVDVEGHSRRSQDGTLSRRTARLVIERDEPFSESIEVREPVDIPAPVEQREERARRYARRVIHDFLEAREPTPVPVEQERKRSYPRRILHEFYEKREPATTIKETTLVFSKTTKHDSPADIAAAAAAAGGLGFNAANTGAQPPAVVAAASSASGLGFNAANTGTQPSAVSITIPLPSVPAVPPLAVGSSGSASTIISVSSQTTILAPAAASATLAAASSAAAVTTAPASVTISAAAGAVTSASASASSSAAASVTLVPAAVSTGAASATISAPAGQPTSTGQPSVGSSAPAGNAPPTSTGSETVPPVTEGSTPPALTVNSNNSVPPASAGSSEPAITVDGATIPERRDVAPLPQTLVRRLAVSGSSWASAVRRQIDSQ